jgi:hypothetical protein
VLGSLALRYARGVRGDPVQVLIGLTIMVAGFANMKRVVRWASNSQGLRPNFFRMFVSLVVGWGTPTGGLYYAQSGSIERTLEATVVASLGFASFMTLLVGASLTWWRRSRPKSYAFCSAWLEAHSSRGLRVGGSRENSRKYRVLTKRFQQQWEAEGPASPQEFIEAHWAEIAEAEAGYRPPRVVR